MKFLENNKALRVSLSAILWFSVYAAVLIYLGFLKNLNFEDLNLLVDAGALTLIAFFGIKVLRFDATNNAFIAENLTNPDLIATNDDLESEIDKVTDDILAEDYLEDLNEKRQTVANRKLTKHIISKLRQQLRDTRLKTKLSLRHRWFSKCKTRLQLIEELEKQINFYSKDENYMVDKKCKPLELKEILNVGSLVKVKEMTENEEHNYDPRKDPLWTWLTSVFKFVGIGSLSIPYAISNDDLAMLPAFFAVLTVSAIITVIRRYIQIRKRTAGPYLQARKKKLKRVREIVKNEVETKSALEAKKNKAENDKVTILRKDTNVVFTIDGTNCMVHRLDFVDIMESPGKFGFGDDYELAYAHMLKEEKIEQFLVDLEESIRDHFRIEKGKRVNKDEFVYSHVTNLIEVELVEIRLQNKGCKTSLVKERFNRTAAIIRVKNKPRIK